jgi:hypothetical protein
MQLYLRDLYLSTYYLYYMFRPAWAIFRYHVYKNVKEDCCMQYQRIRRYCIIK